jgi:hypothetical protein
MMENKAQHLQQRSSAARFECEAEVFTPPPNGGIPRKEATSVSFIRIALCATGALVLALFILVGITLASLATSIIHGGIPSSTTKSNKRSTMGSIAKRTFSRLLR